jgi:hypothetical protein
VAFVVGGLAGAAVQASWLLDPSPVTNWTLPRAHHFSFPGWYHACYLVLAAGSIAAMGTLGARRLRSAPPVVRRRTAEGWGFPCCGCAVSLRVSAGLDSSGSSGTSASQSTLVAAAGAVAVGTAILAYAFAGVRSSVLLRNVTGTTVAAAVIALLTTLIKWFA